MWTEFIWLTRNLVQSRAVLTTVIKFQVPNAGNLFIA